MMDSEKCKLLTQGIEFLQKNLHLDDSVVKNLCRCEVISSEQAKNITKDENICGRIVELVSVLKKGDKNTFKDLLTCLESTGRYEEVCRYLYSKPTSRRSEDARTASMLSEELVDYNIPQSLMQRLAELLTPTSVYQTDIWSLQDKISKESRCRGTNGLKLRVNTSNLERSKSTSSEDGKSGSNDALIQEKDIIIARKDREYIKLRDILAETQTDFQETLDLNSKYLDIIRQLNEMQVQVSSSIDKNRSNSKEIEEKLAISQIKVEELSGELEDLSEEQTEQKIELDKLQAREQMYKKSLGLDERATELCIQRKIQEIINTGSLNESELRRIESELVRTRQSKAAIEERLMSLSREKEKVEFHVRQQSLTIKKMYRMKSARGVVDSASSILLANLGPRLSSEIRLPTIIDEKPLSTPKTLSSPPIYRYCIFCRSEFKTNANIMSSPTSCRFHRSAYRQGKWTCCRDNNHRSVGCLATGHFYVVVNGNGPMASTMLTDGQRSVDLSM